MWRIRYWWQLLGPWQEARMDATSPTALPEPECWTDDDERDLADPTRFELIPWLTAAEKQMTRCDRCNARRYTSWRHDAHTLQFCGHHNAANRVALMAQGWREYTTAL